MSLTVHIPDDVARRIGASEGELSRRALEEFRHGHVTKPELRRMLGFETREALDGFLKAHGIFLKYTLEDLEQDRRDLRRIGL
jgi:hypothetical protein